MRRAKIPWEFGKYAVILVLGVALLRTWNTRRSWVPAIYFALLLPSAILTFTSLDSWEARNQLSFNLSGPLALAVSLLFFSSLRLRPRELRWIYACLLAPIVSIATIATVNLRKLDPDDFANQSNRIASGGFGPNQVSAILGLGILATVFWIANWRRKIPWRGRFSVY